MNKLAILVLTGLALFGSPPQLLKASEITAYHFRQDVTVYVTKTGEKYHRGDCSYLSRSKISISKEKAVAAGYGACSRCKP